MDITNSNWIPNILKDKNSTCNTTNSHHIPTIELLTDDVIFLNQFEGPIIIDKEGRHIKGTYLIKIQNSTITISGKDYHYYSNEISTTKILPAILQPQFIKNELQQKLSLELLQEIHINNTKEIDLLKERTISDQLLSIISIGPTTIVILILIIVIFINTKQRNKIIFSNQLDKASQNQTSTQTSLAKESVISISTPEVKEANIPQPPTYMPQSPPQPNITQNNTQTVKSHERKPSLVPKTRKFNFQHVNF